MKKTIYLILTIFMLYGCDSKIKNEDAKIQVETGTDFENSEKLNLADRNLQSNSDYIGSWVGFFEQDNEKFDDQKYVPVDEGYVWLRENKINLFIEQITGKEVKGHSVVAGNNRPFKGELLDGEFVLKEPGDNRYDGQFKFKIENDTLVGTWKAFRKVDISKRKYVLAKKNFSYDPNIMLEKAKAYVNWNKFLKESSMEEIDDGVFEEWITKEFSSATDLIYKINASNTVLTKKQVENLKKGDLIIIRNTIYARHGYSFKDRPLRVFFDAQSWYIPVNSDIKSNFTDLEKANIKLLLRYEKNASEYYDYFGRG